MALAADIAAGVLFGGGLVVRKRFLATFAIGAGDRARGIPGHQAGYPGRINPHRRIEHVFLEQLPGAFDRPARRGAAAAFLHGFRRLAARCGRHAFQGRRQPEGGAFGRAADCRFAGADFAAFALGRSNWRREIGIRIGRRLR
jgi:hypothetical protein